MQFLKLLGPLNVGVAWKFTTRRVSSGRRIAARPGRTVCGAAAWNGSDPQACCRSGSSAGQLLPWNWTASDVTIKPSYLIHPFGWMRFTKSTVPPGLVSLFTLLSRCRMDFGGIPFTRIQMLQGRPQTQPANKIILQKPHPGVGAWFLSIVARNAADLPGGGGGGSRPGGRYLRIGSLYGSGFFYIPGTATCIHLGGYLASTPPSTAAFTPAGVVR